ncbi:MAG TPA: transglutaminase-like domain-containing protein [Prolixibacteraceae bacterium]|nr:transglutaminase-like domain-containing protein [Prolixibacteraceae bacterium]
MRQLTIILILTVATLFLSCNTKAEKGQTLYKGLPLIKATSNKADYKIGSEWVKGNWIIMPEVPNDTLPITCFSKFENVVFYTDKDSISFKVCTGESHKFYVLLNDKSYALTEIKGISPPKRSTLQFDSKSNNSTLQFWYEQNKGNKYLDLLVEKYHIDTLIQHAMSDTEKAFRILHWVHKQWKHNGSNEPKKSDAISILEEVKAGKNFRCVEYGIVTTACLNSIGLKARTLGLRTSDVETRPSGAGHVLLEVYLDDLQKWALLDGQWDAMPFLNQVPLNAVEFQKAISENYNELEIRTSSELSKRNYVEWIYPYLYYFNISFDNREGVDDDRKKISGKSYLMLVPVGANKPTIFQIKNKIDNCLYTNSLNDFYESPNIIDK